MVQLGTSTPIARARVSIANAQTLTDEGGRFVFPNLQPGRYLVLVSHNAYLAARFGERTSGGAGRAVAPGQSR